MSQSNNFLAKVEKIADKHMLFVEDINEADGMTEFSFSSPTHGMFGFFIESDDPKFWKRLEQEIKKHCSNG